MSDITGMFAAVIDIGASWMFDIKEGVCSNAFWLNREQCCWMANDTAPFGSNKHCSTVSLAFSYCGG